MKTLKDIFPTQPLPFAPVIGFKSDEAARKYIDRRPNQTLVLLTQAETGGAALVLFRLDLAAMFPSLLAYMVCEDEPDFPFTDRGRWTNQRNPFEFPQKRDLGGGFPALLLVDGPQHFYRRLDALPPHLNWLEQLIHGPRDCVFMWAQREGRATFKLPWAPNHLFSVGRRARGLCYWKEATYSTVSEKARDKKRKAIVSSSNGDVDGIQTAAVLIDLTVEGKSSRSLKKVTRTSRDRLIKSVPFWSRHWSPNFDAPIDPTSTIMDDVDTQLLKVATEAFEQHCSPHHHSLMACRENIISHTTNPSASGFNRNTEPTFHSLFKDAYRAFINPELIWKTALGKIEWPWQMGIVIQQHLWTQRASNPPGGKYPIFRTVLSLSKGVN